MTPKIFLTKDTSKPQPWFNSHALCVYHKSHSPPSVEQWRYSEWSEFKDRPRELLRAVERLVVVGLNSIITPGNRTHLVFEVLFNNTPDLPKLSIDRTLFVSEPWRAWFHFGLVGAKYRDYSYSYIAESHYNAFVDGAREDNPFSIEEVTTWGRGVIACEYPVFGGLSITTQQLMPSVHDEYARLKEECFEQETSIKAIVSRLSEFAQSACSDRRIPRPSDLFKKDAHHIVKTDLRIDDWLVSQLENMMSLANGVAEEFCNGADG